MIRSLRARLVALVLLAALPALALTLYQGLQARKIAAQQATDEALRLARLAAAGQEATVEGARHLLTALAHLPAVQDGDPAACNRLLSDLQPYFPHLITFGVLDLNGDLWCSALPVPAPVNGADRAYFQRALATGDFAVGDFQIGRVTGRPSINFGYPVRDRAGAINGVVLAALDLQVLQDMAASIGLPEGAALTVRDRNGLVLARHPDPETWVGQTTNDAPLFQAIDRAQAEGTAQAPGLDGVQRLYAFTPVGGAQPWAFVSVGIPASVAFAAADRITEANLMALGAVALLALALAWFGAEALAVRPLRRLQQAAQRVAAGDLSARSGPAAGPAEFRQLAQSFDRMAEALEAREAEQRAAEAQVRRLNQELEGRVAERTAQLSAANRELEAFAYSVSHDLRAPLRSIDGFSQALLEDYGPRLDSEGRAHLDRVRAAAQRMGALIDDLLALSRLTRIEFRPQEVDLSALAREIARDLRAAAPEREAEVRVAEGVTARGDAILLRAALENLLSNAWKFTGRQARARIEFGAQTSSAQETVYFVRDNGAGFDMQYAERLFSPFQRLHRADDFPGTGVGLATVQRVVHRHGGRVWAEAAPGQGAVFYFTLNNLAGQESEPA